MGNPNSKRARRRQAARDRQSSRTAEDGFWTYVSRTFGPHYATPEARAWVDHQTDLIRKGEDRRFIRDIQQMFGVATTGRTSCP